MSQLTWEETKGIMSELEALYADRRDVDSVHEIHGLTQEVVAEARRDERDAKEIIRAMTSRVSKRKEEVVPPSEEEFAARKAAVDSERAQVEAEIATADATARDKEKAIQDLGEDISTATASLHAIVEDHSASMPSIRGSLALYSNITDIKWDYTKDPNTLAGYIAIQDTQTVRAFQFDIATGDRFAIAQHLWDLVEKRGGAAAEA